MNIRKVITRNLLNARGWQTRRKIVVIESDDWGTIRSSGKEAYEQLLRHNLPVDKSPYCALDMLENNTDIEMLYDTLSSVKDKHGNPAVITANNIVANPDFEKIKDSGFTQYFFEPFTETYKRYPDHNRVFQLYKEGIDKKLFVPQFHGREHVNVPRWMKALQSADKVTPVVNELLDALDGDSAEELGGKFSSLEEGLQMFKHIWGFDSKSFIAPCYIWDSALEPQLAAKGVQYLQGMIIQLQPTAEPGYQYQRKFHYQGQRNQYGQRYLVRNAFFEPSTDTSFDWSGDCFNRIETAFRWNKPAIISAHRLNFMGGIQPQNREKNLALLKQLLKKITQRWPQVEFMSSNQLGDLMNTNG
jgi:hypothetical protein